MKLRAMFIGAALCVAILAATSATATSITYTATGTQSGMIGTQSFTDATVTLTVTANTTGVVPSSINPNYLANPSITATITIGGIGTATITDTIFVVSTFNSSFNGGDTAFIYDATDGRVLLGAFNPAFLGYGLTTAIGPLSGPTFASGCNNNACNFQTSLGTLNWAGTTGQGPTATFAATVATVPEPASLMLLLTGMAAIGVAKRRI